MAKRPKGDDTNGRHSMLGGGIFLLVQQSWTPTDFPKCFVCRDDYPDFTMNEERAD